MDRRAQEDEDDEAEMAAREEEVDGGNAEDGGGGGDIDDDCDAVMIDEPARKTQREKRNERAGSVLAAIDTHRNVVSSVRTPAKESATSLPKRNPPKTTKDAGLDANWREKIAGLATKSSPAPSVTSSEARPRKNSAKTKANNRVGNANHANVTPGRTTAQSRQRKGGNESRQSAVQEKGLTDKDVETRRDEVVRLQKTQQQYVAIESEDVPSAKPKSRIRRPPSAIPPEKSKSADNLPDFLRDVWDETILPSLKEKYGAATKLWDIEHGALTLRDELQNLIDQLCPHAEYEVAASTKDLVYEVTRSRLFHWRKLFMITAKKLVDPVLRSLPNVVARKRYVSDALKYGGVAYFDTPDGEPGHSRFVLETFATHLNGIKGSVVASSCGRPYSALALTFAAVQRAFMSWETGVDAGTPDWSGESMKPLIESTWRTNIANYISQPGAFDRIIAGAVDTLEAGLGKKRGTHHKMRHDPKNEAISLFQPTVPAARDNSESFQSDITGQNSEYEVDNDEYGTDGTGRDETADGLTESSEGGMLLTGTEDSEQVYYEYEQEPEGMDMEEGNWDEDGADEEDNFWNGED
ncbi:uncharacterized protein B0H18DRAFT_1038515 [Fomitopsis serialis]|uniref:uncharacterized protein n=1 Tax=Fomitopsis serialis TaxID=139415 RepID=UPI002008CDD8|nr:uncharacterized protein B0H18DRAFT_1038515 [Neoantrodia serialis]KAH9916451.1 hypothetical protein B0H18DRAFT_1038515 [Neoantrodia serialis]